MKGLQHNDHISFELDGVRLVGRISAGGNVCYFMNNTLIHVDIDTIQNLECIGTMNSFIVIHKIVDQLARI